MYIRSNLAETRTRLCSRSLTATVVILRFTAIGKEVAEFASRHFSEELRKEPKYVAKEYEEALKNTFLKIDTLLVTEEGKKEVKEITENAKGKADTEPSFYETAEEGVDMKGCTANVVLIKDGKIYIANAGDSRAIAIMSDGKVEELSVDHKPENEPEAARITKAGGTIFNGRVEGNLNLSRGLGDLHYKANKSLKPEEQMICAYPDVRVKEISKGLKYVLMGCDGVYEIWNSQEIGNFVLKETKDPSVKLTTVVEKLLDSIVSPDYMKTGGAGCDNMTCILIRFNNFQ
eukprot:TRINITY_DN847_c0_g1_i6.p1 TRINITY_DN847_c0_g1~~TRINITY_DN847_c0_g1_i6.p1  ORF type:complete len:289 (+),score=100.16 TRINITY_DN847_c0_g1_i6:227-1093(+)